MIEAAFILATFGLSLYGVNAILLACVYWFRRATRRPGAPQPTSRLPSPLPSVVIQLPVYNEALVIQRIIDATAQMDYPPDRLIIQVLDDSSDETTALAAERVAFWKEKGKDIRLVHRILRTEYKAGALQFGLSRVESEFVAVFDADFIPPADWLRRALEPFFEPGGDTIGMVQTRWGHLNDSESALTHAEALLLDGHFGIEQRVRSDEGLLFGFNGTGGIWRRQCIEAGGGWSGVTLSEDLDLSYRAQLAGWKFRYLPNVVAPAELPTTISAFKIQQYRWAKGSMQAVRRQAPRLLRAPIRPWKKIQGLLHLSGFIVHPLMVLMALLSLPLAVLYPGGIPGAWLGIGALGTPILFLAAEASLYPAGIWWKRLLWLPVLIMLGTGIAVSNTKGVLAGLLNIRSPFQRTPKQGDGPAGRRYFQTVRELGKADWVTVLEFLLAVYCLFGAAIDVEQGNWINAVFLGAYAAGFSWVSLAAVWETLFPQLAAVFSLRRNKTRSIRTTR
jgi:cellulose synthase/poly-beta-1,6-N-acetylglucosamine synthase-like glycosyltransferase